MKNCPSEERKKIVEDYFRFAGFGKFTLDTNAEPEGIVACPSDHYGVGWASKFGKSSSPVSFFTAGFLAGAIESIYDLELGTLVCHQEKCLAMGDEESTFKVSKSSETRNLLVSQREGKYQTYSLNQPEGTTVDYAAVRDALTNMPIEGSEQSGIIDAFGVLLTRHYANYYANISYGFLDAFGKKNGK